MRRLSIALCVLLAGGLSLSWLAGSYLIAGTPRAVALPPGVAAQPVSLPLPGERTVAGWFVPGTGQGALLLLHGIRADRRQMLGRARFLAASGYSVLLIDLPGHGASRAPAISFGLNEADAVRTSLAWLRERLPGQPVGVIGVSLGAAAFMLCKTCPQVDAVVLESMYPTIEEAVEDRLRMRVGMLATPLSRLLLWQLPLRLDIQPSQLRPIEAMAGLRTPVMVVSGDADRHTTIAETRRIFAAAPEPKRLWEVRGAGHVDLYRYDAHEYQARVGRFLAERIGARTMAARQD